MDLHRYAPLGPNPHRSDAVEAGGLVYVSGIIPDKKDLPADLASQAAQVLSKIDTILEAAGTGRSRLIWANIWLSDIAERETFNFVWNDWVVPGEGPARVCTGADLSPGIKVEIAVIAAKP